LHCYLREVELVGIDPSERMLEIARERAGVFGCGVDLRVGDAQALEFADASFRTVVSTQLETLERSRGGSSNAPWRGGRRLSRTNQRLLGSLTRSPISKPPLLPDL